MRNNKTIPHSQWHIISLFARFICLRLFVFIASFVQFETIKERFNGHTERKESHWRVALCAYYIVVCCFYAYYSSLAWAPSIAYTLRCLCDGNINLSACRSIESRIAAALLLIVAFIITSYYTRIIHLIWSSLWGFVRFINRQINSMLWLKCSNRLRTYKLDSRWQWTSSTYNCCSTNWSPDFMISSPFIDTSMKRRQTIWKKQTWKTINAPNRSKIPKTNKRKNYYEFGELKFKSRQLRGGIDTKTWKNHKFIVEIVLCFLGGCEPLSARSSVHWI